MISQVTGIFDQSYTISLPFHPLLLDDPNLFFQHKYWTLLSIACTGKATDESVLETI